MALTATRAAVNDLGAVDLEVSHARVLAGNLEVVAAVEQLAALRTLVVEAMRSMVWRMESTWSWLASRSSVERPDLLAVSLTPALQLGQQRTGFPSGRLQRC